MDTFGRVFRVSIFGESHGACIGVLIDGVPAGIPLEDVDFLPDLQRRKGGEKGTTARREADIPLLKSGVFENKTTGAPLLVLIENADSDSRPYELLRDIPRPGHADFVSAIKYGRYNDYRGGGHFSGRLTAALVLAGVIAKKIATPITIEARVTEIGGEKSSYEKVIAQALAERDSLGGIVECCVRGIPPGLGEPFFDSIESLIAHAAFSIPGVKGVEFGAGFASARMKGSDYTDSIVDISGTTATNRAGGINGGITNGNEIFWKAAIRPPSSIGKEGRSVNLRTGEKVSISVEGRHDACFALRIPVIIEAITAMVLVDCMMLEHRIPRIASS